MLIILSPAKTMDISSTNMPHMQSVPAGTVPQFDADAEFLASKMKCYSESELGSLLKISPVLAHINYERYRNFDAIDTPRKPAIFAYNGSVFKAISPSDFSVGDTIYAQDRLRIISTLYGLTRPLDMIKAYRIAFSLKLEGVAWIANSSNISGVPGASSTSAKKADLYNYWHGKLTEPLIEATRTAGGVLVNLASLDVQAALDMDQLRRSVKVITPDFKQLKNGKYEVIRTYAKIARGSMTRFIIKNRIETPQDLKSFEWNGYQFNSHLSDNDTFIYTRDN